MSRSIEKEHFELVRSTMAAVQREVLLARRSSGPRQMVLT
jgi:hypothetical protein